MTRMQGNGWPRLSESPLETKGLGAGQEEVPQHGGKGSQAISLRMNSRFTWGRAAPWRAGVGTLVSFLQESGAHEAGPGMKGTRLTAGSFSLPR